MTAVINSDYLIFANESGDHGLVSIDEQFPVFALVFCVVQKQDYVEQIVPAMQRLKMAYWGHDQVILHEHDIRKEKGPFAHLFVDKRSNSNGLQLADLVARPLALRHLRPDQSNRALQALDDKLLNFKVFP
ncbi:MAG: DUF3800 domain-containing protein [Acidithiobacillus sp.]